HGDQLVHNRRSCLAAFLRRTAILGVTAATACGQRHIEQYRVPPTLSHLEVLSTIASSESFLVSSAVGTSNCEIVAVDGLGGKLVRLAATGAIAETAAIYPRLRR